MRLTRIDDAAEDGWIRATADRQGLGELWIGGSSATVAGDWSWIDGAPFWSGAANGAPVMGAYAHWQPNEPSSAPASACMRAAGAWAAHAPSTPAPFACERY